MPPRACRIVAIDRDAALGQRLLTAFWGPEYSFHWFADGREALGALQEIRPDVIVSELMLPGLDGGALLETVRLWPSMRDVPFLVLSSVRSNAIIRATLDAGANAYLVKPCSVTQLKETIQMLVEEHLARHPDLDVAEEPRSVVPAGGPPSEPSPPQGPVERPTAGDGRLAAPSEGETVQDSRPRAGDDAASEAGTETEDAPPPPIRAKGRPAPRPNRSARKRKTPAAAPQAPEPALVPGESPSEPVHAFGELAAAPAVAEQSLLRDPLPPGSTSASVSWQWRTVSWGRVLRVAAALLAVGVMSDSQGRDPLPEGVTARTKHEPSDTPIEPSPPPATQPPTAAEPSPQPSAEPAVETPRPASRRSVAVDQMVRGRLQWAQALYDDGRYDDARAALSEVMKLEPSNLEALHLTAQLERYATRLPGSAKSAPEADERAVMALLWRYQTAIEHRDVTSLDAIWPTVDTAALLARWKDAPPRPLALRLVSLEVTGDRAVAMCVSYVAATDGDQPSNSSSRLSFHLKRANGSWVIADVS